MLKKFSYIQATTFGIVILNKRVVNCSTGASCETSSANKAELTLTFLQIFLVGAFPLREKCQTLTVTFLSRPQTSQKGPLFTETTTAKSGQRKLSAVLSFFTFLN